MKELVDLVGGEIILADSVLTLNEKLMQIDEAEEKYGLPEEVIWHWTDVEVFTALRGILPREVNAYNDWTVGGMVGSDIILMSKDDLDWSGELDEKISVFVWDMENLILWSGNQAFVNLSLDSDKLEVISNWAVYN